MFSGTQPLRQIPGLPEEQGRVPDACGGTSLEDGPPPPCAAQRPAVVALLPVPADASSSWILFKFKWANISLYFKKIWGQLRFSLGQLELAFGTVTKKKLVWSPALSKSENMRGEKNLSFQSKKKNKKRHLTVKKSDKIEKQRHVF